MKTEKKRSFKGAVLFTVVSVMSLLIVFLTSTLVLATAANNRAHKSYSSSQANYTARGAIDGILAAIEDNEEFAELVASVDTPNEVIDVNVEMDSTASGIGKVTSAQVAYVRKEEYYNNEKKKWVENDLISITVEVVSGGENQKVTAYLLKNPPTSGNPNTGGGFVTVGGATLGNHTNTFGGSYLGIGIGKGTRLYQGSYPGAAGYISLGDKQYLQHDQSFTWNRESTVEAPLVVNGDFSLETNTEVIFPFKGTGIAIWGNMTMGQGNFKAYTNTIDASEINEFKDIPYIFVDSVLRPATNSSIGSPELPLNVFCGSIDVSSSNGISTIIGDIYCQDEGITSNIGNSSAQTVLKAWSDSVISGSDVQMRSTTSGNFYTKGNLEINGNGADIKGDLVVEGSLTVNGPLKVGGNIVVGGMLTVNNSNIEIGAGKSIYADMAAGSEVGGEITKKMTSDGSQELYERQEIVTYYVLGRNVKVRSGPNPWEVSHYMHVWLSPDALDIYGLDNDGDGLVDGDGFYDFGGAEITNAPPFVEPAWINNPYVENKKEYSHETVWVNREDPSDVTKNETDTYDTVSNLTFKGNQIKLISDYLLLNHELFPRQAEKAVILGIETIDGIQNPTKEQVESSKIIETVDEIEDRYNFDNKIKHANKKYEQLKDKIESNIYTFSEATPYKNGVQCDDPNHGSGDFEITESCTIQGTVKRNIKIKCTEGEEICVVLDNTYFEQIGSNIPGIVFDDTSGTLNLFIKGSNIINKGSIMTMKYKDLIENNTPFQIITPGGTLLDTAVYGEKAPCPKINIYTVPNQSAYLELMNNAIVTATIEAPELTFKLQNAKVVNAPIAYNGTPNINEAWGVGKQIGVIGVLNVKEAADSNNWAFLYTPQDGSDTDVEGADSHNTDYKVAYYDYY